MSGPGPHQGWGNIDYSTQDSADGMLDFRWVAAFVNVPVHSHSQVGQDSVDVVVARQNRQDEVRVVGPKQQEVARTVEISHINIKDRGAKFLVAESFLRVVE